MKNILLTLCFLALSGCFSKAPSPVINKAPHRVIPAEHIVKNGESIYAISWAYGIDYLNIAKWNGLKAPYALQPGQHLSLRKGVPKTTVIATAKPQETEIVSSPLSSATTTTQTPSQTTTPALESAVNAPSTPLVTPSQWHWPAKGKVIGQFSRDKGVNGIQIEGNAGSPVTATATGDVVYVGDGLRGYGQLIIIKHSEKYLSAYAHNRKILVNEGERIKAGQQIGEMGSSGTDKTMLHFEIRVNGKPDDPLKFLKQ